MHATSDYSSKIESTIQWFVEKIAKGIPNPTGDGMLIKPVKEEAAELLADVDQDADAAVEEFIKRVYNNGYRNQVMRESVDVLLGMIPGFGIPAMLVKKLMFKMRNCAIIACLYGCNIEDPEIQSLLVRCLVPVSGSSGEAESASGSNDSSASAESTPSLNDADSTLGFAGTDASAVLKDVGRTIVRETLRAAAGKFASKVAVSVYDKVADLWSTPTNDQETSESPEAIARIVFRNASVSNRRIRIMKLGFLALLSVSPGLLRMLQLCWRGVAPLMRGEVPLFYSFGVYCVIVGVLICVWMIPQECEGRSIAPILCIRYASSFLFVVHSAIPCISAFFATKHVAEKFLGLRATWQALLGLYNMVTLYARWVSDRRTQALPESVPRRRSCSFLHLMFPPAVEAGAPWFAVLMGRILWCCIIFLFVFDEVLGRLLGFHLGQLVGFTELHSDHLDDGLGKWLSIITFAACIAQTFAVQALLNELQRWDTLLQLLGTKNAYLAATQLLLLSVGAIFNMQALADWLIEISPHPKVCCLILYLKKYGIFIGCGIPLSYFTLFLIANHYSGISAVVTLSMIIVGLLFKDWCDNREHLEKTRCRVVLLFPGIHADAKKRAICTLQNMGKMIVKQGVKRAAAGGASAFIRCVRPRLM